MTVARSSCCFGVRPLIEAMRGLAGGTEVSMILGVEFNGEVFREVHFVFLFGCTGERNGAGTASPRKGLNLASKGTTQAPAPGARDPAVAALLGGRLWRSFSAP